MAPRDKRSKSCSSSAAHARQVRFMPSRPAPTATSPTPSERSDEAPRTSGDNSPRARQHRSSEATPRTQEGVSSVPQFNSDTTVPTAGQRIFTHHTSGPQTGLFTPTFAHIGQQFIPTALPQHYTNPNQSFFIAGSAVPFSAYPNPAQPANMSDYENTGTTDRGFHFQPQVPDTSFGPHLHTFVPPRQDQGLFYVQQLAPPSGVPLQAVPVAYPMQQIPAGQVPILAPATMPVNPAVFQQPVNQSGMVHAVPVASNISPQPAPIAVSIQNPPPFQQFPAGVPTSINGLAYQYEPTVGGFGPTVSDIIMQHAQVAADNNLFEPQDFKPADDDPSRFYMCRELDGAWTQRTRYTIDHIGCRWYLTDEGYFYAVRLPN
ncbi:hypothetical protein GQ53DRAFT_747151 [Thozetella sp. PMI_491]|nr:hypothetical protein GQ53DRAFT_747151 [Thozetella sp. PMI_491]